LGLSWTPNKVFSLAAVSYLGKFGATVPGLDGERALIDLVGTYNATSALTFIVNVDWDHQDQATGPGSSGATWYGVAGYANYAFNSLWRVSFRAEYLDDKDGGVTAAMASVVPYAGSFTGQHFWEGTLTFGYDPTANFELRLEGRYDSSQTEIFLRQRAVGENPAELGDSLSQFAVQGIFKF
jgi:hypothetical protein